MPLQNCQQKVFSSHLWHLFFMLLDSYLWLVLWIKYTKVWCLICLPHVFWFIQNSFLCKLQIKRIGISFFLIFICKQNIQKMSVNAFGIKHNVYQDFWLNTSLFTLIRIFNPKWQKWQHHDKTCLKKMRWAPNDNYSDTIFFSATCKFGSRCKHIGNNETLSVLKHFSIEWKKIL